MSNEAWGGLAILVYFAIGIVTAVWVATGVALYGDIQTLPIKSILTIVLWPIYWLWTFFMWVRV